ncbi:heterokaryon incompatibility protein-domain-containing protein [Immersiella caudata]|uniref:Heterokaryon incompatibility protein-domain-containing protein n=1 Tax=Immersiella caudata TaxID=314043 RepID=A0AA39XIX2_9PEZI|nr:heterokaryon incompatibility protein-domain-containing protein [Immersiella caudata]
MRCDVCMNLSNDRWSHYQQVRGTDDIPYEDWREKAQRSAAEFVKSAASGCIGCLLIVHGFRKLVAYWEAHDRSGGWISQVTGPRRATESESFRLNHSAQWTHWTASEIEFFSLKGSPTLWHPTWLKLGTASFLPLSTGRQTSLTKLQAWLTECRTQHPSCGSMHRRLPRRVLDVGNADHTPSSVRLYESQQEDDEYICLSYRWPGTASAKLLRRNLEQYKVAIPLDEIPLTFKEVFEVARSLRVRYVWIDALCIIQDDEVGEKAQDIANMNLIYESALLTVFSAWSTEQLFSTAGEHYRHHEIERGVFVRHALRHFFEDQSAKTSLLIMDRAWIFQERILSGRAVYFTEYELVWDCQRSLRCQCRDPHDQANPRSRDPNKSRTLFRDPEAFPFAVWWTCVAEYSKLKMTHSSDRLRAIQGIAMHMRTKWQRGKYLAGLWEDTLLQDLCWTLGPNETPQPRPGTPRAPTWSWASINSQVVGILENEQQSITSSTAAATAVATTASLSWMLDTHRDSVLSINTVVVDALMRPGPINGMYSFTTTRKGSRFYTSLREPDRISLQQFIPDHNGFQRPLKSLDEMNVEVRLLKMFDMRRWDGIHGVWLVVKGVEDPERNLHERVGRLVILKRDYKKVYEDQELLGDGEKLEILLQ